MGYGIIIDEGLLQMVDREHEGAMEIIDERPATAEGEVAAVSRYEVEGGKIYVRYAVEPLPKTSKSYVDILAEAVAKRLMGANG